MHQAISRKLVQAKETVDFSGLFKLDVLIQLDLRTYSFYEVGLKKFFAFASDKELIFVYINPHSERFENNYDWDFLDNPIYTICFEPSGTWVVIISEQKVLLIPFLPLFIPQNEFDHKWSLSSVTVLPLGNVVRPTSTVFWLTRESENVLIIGLKNGGILFYSLESQSIVGECKVSGEINDLQMCFDDSLDLLTLLITSNKSQQWKLVLEHRSVGYSWIQQIRSQNDKDKKESFMSYIRQLSKDKITFFTQGSSKADESKPQVVEHLMKPSDYQPLFRKSGNTWSLTAQYVNGRHFLTAFELNEGKLILENPEENIPSRTLRPMIRNDGLYIQGLWSPRLIYLLRRNALEIHSTTFSVIQGDGLLETKREYTDLWIVELIGQVRRAHLMTARDPPPTSGGWQKAILLSDLKLPRFSIEPCLVITSCGAYIMNTVCDPCEWIVSLIMRGGSGAEQSATGLGAPVSDLLRAASDMLMARGKITPAHYLYSLSQCDPDGWVARLGVFGQLHHLLTFKPLRNTGDFSHPAITIKILTTLHKMSTDNKVKVDLDVKFATLLPTELEELTWFTAAIGLWHLVPVFSISRGNPASILSASKYKRSICRGALNSLVTQRSLILVLIERDEEWLFTFLTENCEKLDTIVLKCICYWMNPLQDQLRPIMRDLNQGISSVYTTRMRRLIAVFLRLAAVIEAREPCPDQYFEVKIIPQTWKNHFTPRRALSCGLAHWAVAENGKAKIMTANSVVNTELIGRVIDVACGRHHTLVLTENGIYSAGDNMFGQLGVGGAWGGAVGELTKASGTLLYVARRFTAPVVTVAAGHYHSAAIDLGGRLYLWGWGVHGQLGLGGIEDQWTPQLVPKFLGRKVVSVSCGACHTCVLAGGEVWVCGAGAWGQLGAAGSRSKSTLPVRVLLPDPVRAIAAGYFHNLALSSTGQVWVWGASPQQVRATATRRAPSTEASSPDAASNAASSPTSPASEPAQEQHLQPQLVDMSNVRGRVVQMAAGWHHSVIMNNVGTIYAWGLNFDGQLGSGNRKIIHVPTEIKIRTDSQPDTVKSSNEQAPEVETEELKSKAIVACGGDFTVYIDDDGRIYATGNALLKMNNEKDKENERMIMMKTTKRIIKIPASLGATKFKFQPIDRMDVMFPSDIDCLQRNPIGPSVNPLTTINDFKKKFWADYMIILLKQWINEDDLKASLNMRAKLACHTKRYSDCLKLLLDNLKSEPPSDCLYVTHTSTSNVEVKVNVTLKSKEAIKNTTTSVVSKRIKEISMGILNEKGYIEVNPSIYKEFYCSCDEMKYFKKIDTPCEPTIPAEDLSTVAANTIDKCISIFPVNADLWEQCFRISKNFYLDNNLPISGLERILRKCMETNATTMAAAIMYSNDCTQYSEILSPKFYLNMCSQVLDTWS